ncbi:MAG: hypothetical protein NVSMB17_13860 [Candidatus Dormibacteria bacterium]
MADVDGSADPAATPAPRSANIRVKQGHPRFNLLLLALLLLGFLVFALVEAQRLAF